MSSEGVFSLETSEGSTDKIVINVGGVKHETYKSTLMTIPGSHLAKLVDTESPSKELFFDRQPEVFTHVLQYYRSGKLHCPTNLCGVLLEEEFAFWGISGADVEPCCWAAFRQHSDVVEALAKFDPSVTMKEVDPGKRDQSSISKTWALFDDPYSSIAAKVIAVISLLFILLSITAFALETNNYFNPPVHQTYVEDGSLANTSAREVFSAPGGVLDKVELVCLVWFIIEFLLRAVSCPSKWRFFINVLNIVDLLALFPWFFRWCSGNHCVGALGFLRVMRCIRVLRVFKLMRHVLGVRVLNYTLRASAPALCTVPLILFSFTLIFGTMLYYAELLPTESNPYTQFVDISSSFWWALVTLTTVGYGDIYPLTVQGKCVGILCAVVGFMLIVLPVPIIVNNFIMFYSLAKAKCSMPRKRENCNVDTVPSTFKASA
ncbi:potassium voltage-gated channel subfamily C member 1 [Myxocyprinus asiaticus]|uniref:potassium voltage-gated channel subfamily C member 1 n=1 Tax=Myxocyprinus asiaticus TaxID=70543 RepID=UPI002222F7D5|nr:potassium voltage-gated channel subfamily C member 1 [Myxocyprinus asiaticus]